MNNPKNQVLRAVQKLGNNVTVADIVAKSGCSLQETTKFLNEIAGETSATLQVSADGQILYCFQPNFQYLYFSRGTAKVFSTVARTLGPVLFFLFKISFGVTLMLSVIVVFGIFLILRSLMSVGTDSGESVAAMWSDFFTALRRLVWLDLRSIRENRAITALGHDSSQNSNLGSRLGSSHKANLRGNFDAGFNDAPPAAPSGQGFLLDCYYFLFGPGDPNEGIDDARWKLIAQSIRLNEGVVLPEHLVPYTGRPPDDERALFLILAKFNGSPFVSESGNILYTFPSMAAPSQVASYAFTAPLLQEQEWRFTGLSRQALKPVILLAVANLLGASLFYSFIAMVGGRHKADLRLFEFFAVYGVLFLAIPCVRWFIVRRKNKSIRQKNEIARKYEEMIGNPDVELGKRLDEAEQLRRYESLEVNKKIVYRTDQDYLEQLSDTEFSENAGKLH